ncbi:MAG: hypothetical protein A2086_07710 [Spirochaetes bacterium GWD1_27_9]|nr:MAG: hypothetical protein A2Z98_10260 [Spirochaetes bacterium GWB1_27_13]OHD26556.1 MAG: hypothetical protein A2Y34_07945 [Spirochaetes bacterium GWC1_27_15]OHD43350.1 MAG: hypothetical protein A2086_07710 [Spirochaetes bacterium GWD1_27_9]
MKNKYFLLFPIFLLFTNCILTFDTYVKESTGIKEFSIDMPIFVDFNHKLQTYLVYKIIKYNDKRIPQLQFTYKSNDAKIFVDVNNLDIKSQATEEDRTQQKIQEEKDEYQRKLEEYEKEKKWAEEHNFSIPIKPEEPSYTTKYTVIKLKFDYSYNIKITKDTNIIFENACKNIYTEEFVKDNYKTSKYNMVETGNVGSDIISNIFGSIIQGLIDSGINAISNAINQKDAASLLKLSSDKLLDKITREVYAEISSRFLYYGKGNLYLLSINKRIDDEISSKINKFSERQKIIEYLEMFSKNTTNNDVKTRVLLNIALLYYYEKDNELKQKYYQLAKKRSINFITLNDLNYIKGFLTDF